jgi:PBSX family phage terminase large subunit
MPEDVIKETLEFRGGNRDLILAHEPDVMAVGPAGTGKTVTSVWKLHFICMKYPGARCLMARKTLESLKSGALATYKNKLQPELYGVRQFGGNKFAPAEFQYPNGSVILVVGMDKADKVLSTEFDVVYVNEATEIRESDWETLRGRLRNGVVPYQMIYGDLNPSGVRHWAYVRMHKGLTRRIETTHKDNPAYWDEKKNDWTDLGRSYIKVTLEGLTGTRRKRLLQGQWATAEGVVYDSFDPQYHVKEMDVTGWRAAMGVDVGTQNPTCILSVYQSPIDNHIHVKKEFYRKGMSSNRILDAIKAEAGLINPDFIAIDPSAVAYILDLQANLLPAYPADNDVLVGIQRVKSVIEAVTEPLDDEGDEYEPEHLFSVDPSCQNLIEEFGMYAFPENARIETDKPVKEFDHSMDALRYVVSRLLLPRMKVGML